MNAEPVSLASVTSLPHKSTRPLSRECAARLAGHLVTAWRYNRLPTSADGRLTRHYQQQVVDGWLQSGDLTSSFDLWMDLKIYVAGDVALNALCASSPQPRFAGAGLLAYLDLDDDVDSCESFNILWHAADAEEMLGRPILRTALMQLFEALQDEPALSAADIKCLLAWEELCARYEGENAGETLEEAAAAAGETWFANQRDLEHRSAAE